MGLMHDKKGMFFLMVTLIVISLFVLSISFFSNYAERKTTQERVETLSSFVTATESDLHRQIFISGYRAIYFMEREIVTSGSYLNKSASALLPEIFYNGTIFGRAEPLLQTGTVGEILSATQLRAAGVSVVMNFSNYSIEIMQEDPWHVMFVFTTDFYATDKGNLASWNKTLVIEVPIALSNFTDPVYLVGTKGTVNPVIVPTPFSVFDSTNLYTQVSAKYYRAHDTAPSFLDRLIGNFTGSANGIESLVYVPDVPAAYQTGQSIVDYYYFGSSSPASCQISGMPGWLRLDAEHQTYYSVNC